VGASEKLLKEQVDRAKRDVGTDLVELRSELAVVQRKVALALAVVVTAVVAFKIGRAMWRRSRNS
jgi:hypothetical protein